MKNLKIAATVVVLSALASGQALALNSGSGSKVFFQREANKQERAASRPQVDQSPAAETPAEPKARKSRKHKH